MQWLFADFVPDYSGGTAPDFHGIPFIMLLVSTLTVFQYFLTRTIIF
jgi:hypothetical protein